MTRALVFSLVPLILLVTACQRTQPAGVLVYADAAGTLYGYDFQERHSRPIAGGADATDPDVDRRGAELTFVQDSGRRPVRRHRITGAEDPLCQEGYPAAPMRFRSPRFSPSSDLVAFISTNAAGTWALYVAKGRGYCAWAADGIRAAAWAPGRDRLVVADGQSVAVWPIADPMNPATSAPKTLRPIFRADSTIRDLDVDRAFTHFAVLTDNALVVRAFDGRSAPVRVPLPSINAAGFALEPRGVSFAPDGRMAAVFCGPERATSVRLIDLTGAGADLGEWPIEPAPGLGRGSWIPALLDSHDAGTEN